MGDSYRVTGEYVTLKVRDSSGASVVSGYYKDAVVSDVDPESLKHHHSKGMIEEVEATPEVEEAAEGDADKVPAKSASKADWVAFATDDARGESKLTPEDAEAMTRDEIAAKFAG